MHSIGIEELFLLVQIDDGGDKEAHVHEATDSKLYYQWRSHIREGHLV